MKPGPSQEKRSLRDHPQAQDQQAQPISDREMGLCFAFTKIHIWSTDQMKITLHATTMIHYG